MEQYSEEEQKRLHEDFVISLNELAKNFSTKNKVPIISMASLLCTVYAEHLGGLISIITKKEKIQEVIDFTLSQIKQIMNHSAETCQESLHKSEDPVIKEMLKKIYGDKQ